MIAHTRAASEALVEAAAGLFLAVLLLIDSCTGNALLTLLPTYNLHSILVHGHT